MIYSPITYYGGKKQMLPHILPLIPNHKSYCEPFFGGGAVFFAKKEVSCELINDKNDNVINFYKIYQTRRKELFDLVSCSLLSRTEHLRSRHIYENPYDFNEVERAWAFWFLSNTSFSGNLEANMKFSRNYERSYRYLQHNKVNLLSEAVISRIEKTQIDNRDALLVIPQMDEKYTFFYLDPPYLNADQGHYHGYSEEDFKKLLEVASKIKGKFLLSCYPGDLVNEYCKDFNWKNILISKKITAAAIHGEKLNSKFEMLVMNYQPLSQTKIIFNQ